MTSDLVLDHIGIAVHNLAAARDTYERLGFTATGLSIHAAPPQLGEPPAPTGSGNHCIMLRDGYVELLGLIEPAKPSAARAMLDSYEGAHILALGSHDAASVRRRIACLGLPIAEPVSLERDVLWGPEGRETRRAAFANAHLDRKTFPEARTFVIEHRTPEIVWQTHQLAHPNGALALAEAWIVAQHPAEAARRYARLVDAPHEETGQDDWTIRLARGRLRVLSPWSVSAKTNEGWSGPSSAMAGIVIAVTDLQHTEDLLRSNAVTFRRTADGLLVSPVAAHGAAVLFIQEN